MVTLGGVPSRGLQCKQHMMTIFKFTTESRSELRASWTSEERGDAAGG